MQQCFLDLRKASEMMAKKSPKLSVFFLQNLWTERMTSKVECALSGEVVSPSLRLMYTPLPLVLIFPMKVVLCKSFTIYRFLKLAYPSLSSLLMFNCLPREFWKLQWELIVTLMPRSKLRLFCNWSKTFHLWRLPYCLETGFNLENSKPSSSIFGICRLEQKWNLKLENELFVVGWLVWLSTW